MFEKSMLRRIFGPMRDEVSSGWRRVLDDELQNSYSSLNIIFFKKGTYSPSRTFGLP
jgi:hypothetical protein